MNSVSLQTLSERLIWALTSCPISVATGQIHTHQPKPNLELGLEPLQVIATVSSQSHPSWARFSSQTLRFTSKTLTRTPEILSGSLCSNLSHSSQINPCYHHQ